MSLADSPDLPATMAASPLGDYRGVVGHWDEAVASDGTIRRHWQALLQADLTYSPPVAQQRQDLCRRLLKEYGVTYNTRGGEQGERLWQLDSWPLLISPSEWQSLSRGVEQRARL